jgi:hypothetical protein
MASSFFDRIDELADAVGHGRLVGKVEVDQVYAHYIHEGVSESGRPLVMHEGGQAHYLRDPLFDGNDKRMEALAVRAITPEGSELREAMSDEMENLSNDVYDLAPREFNDLRASGHPSVTDAGAVIYDRPPLVHRLSEDELKAKSHVRSLFRFDRRRPGTFGE